MSRCAIAVEVDAEAGPVACGDVAPYEVERWGRNEANANLPLCSHHAWHALDDGASVTGPDGHPCAINDDGEVVEVLS